MILDGFGIAPEKGNAIKAAHKPNLDRLFSSNPITQIGASGMDVGLPDGQMGNSEVGHTNIGAGRIVYQELTASPRPSKMATSLRTPPSSPQWITPLRKRPRCISLGCSPTAVCTATTPTCMPWWNWPSAAA